MRLDYAPGAILYFKFATVRPSTGAPFALSGGTVSVYKDNSTTQSTTGVTLTADFDSVTGLNHVTVDTSADGTFYSTGSSFQLVITAGTVDSVSVVGQVVGEFSLNRTSALRPTTAGRTLDVSTGGEAGIDWANVGSPTTTLNLSGTTVKTATDVETDTVDIQSRLPAALVSGRIDASVGAMAANTLTASALAADAVTEIQTGIGGGGGLDAAGVRAAIGLASANLDTQLAAIDDYLDTEIAAIKAKTDTIPSWPTNFSSLGINASGHISRVTLVDTTTTNTDMRGTDNAATSAALASLVATVGVAGAGLTALASATSLSTAAGYIDTEVAAIKAKTDNLPADPADASDIAAAFSTVNSTLAAIAAYIDTEIAAIKTKTDGLPSDTAATLTTIQGYVDTLETELAKVIKTGESRTIARTGKTDVTFTETRV